MNTSPDTKFSRQIPLETQQLRGKAFGSILTTTREQTIVDCLTYPERSGGIEEVIRSLSTFPYVDQDALMELLEGESASLKSRVGWLIDMKRDTWRTESIVIDELKSEIGTGPVRLDKQSGVSNGGEGNINWTRN